jgi:hypothetical protein
LSPDEGAIVSVSLFLPAILPLLRLTFNFALLSLLWMDFSRELEELVFWRRLAGLLLRLVLTSSSWK